MSLLNQSLTTLAAFVFVLGIVIFIHEFGHFITAKLYGMRVFVFSFGFGKRLIGFKWGDTDCRISLVPLGGYVKLEGEPEDLVSEDTSALGDGRDFTSRSRFQRFVVYLAGPAMNFALTLAVGTVVFMRGFPLDAALFDRPIIGAVEAGGPGALAGLQAGDEIVAIDGQPQETWEDARYAILIRPDATLRLRVRRGPSDRGQAPSDRGQAGEERDVAVRSVAMAVEKVGSIGVWPLVRIGSVLPGSGAEKAGLHPDDAILSIGGKPIRAFGEIPGIVAESKGRPLQLEIWRRGSVLPVELTPRSDAGAWRIGVGYKTVVRKFDFARAGLESARWTWSMTAQTFEVLGRLVTARLSPKTMMGPIGIAQASGEVARAEGVEGLIKFAAMISLQVGILNLIVPIPILDSGQMMILLLEGLRRRDLSVQARGWLMQAGLLAIALLVVLVVYSDLSKTAWLKDILP